MNNEIIKEMIKYIEELEMQVEGEWGVCRSLDEIISEGDMPELYDKLLKLV